MIMMVSIVMVILIALLTIFPFFYLQHPFLDRLR